MDTAFSLVVGFLRERIRVAIVQGLTPHEQEITTSKVQDILLNKFEKINKKLDSLIDRPLRDATSHFESALVCLKSSIAPMMLFESRKNAMSALKSCADMSGKDIFDKAMLSAKF